MRTRLEVKKKEIHKTVEDAKQIVDHYLTQHKKLMPKCSLQRGRRIEVLGS